MAWTYTTLKTAIQDYLQTTESSFVSNLPTFITQAEERILRTVQLPDFKKNVTANVSNGNQYLAMPSDFLSQYSMAIDNSGYEYLLFKDTNFIREVSPDVTVTGVPKYYGIFDDSNFILGPTPNSNYFVELHYLYKPLSISVDPSGTSWLGTNAENSLLYGSLIEAYTYLKGDPDLMSLYQSKFDESLAQLKILGEGYNTTDNYRSGAVFVRRG
jgi:hypothetical protein|tara:strand:+ start:1416 stop:2057 length:642 start_codon:yes stop_codon:yes gene_type:complete